MIETPRTQRILRTRRSQENKLNIALMIAIIGSIIVSAIGYNMVIAYGDSLRMEHQHSEIVGILERNAR